MLCLERGFMQFVDRKRQLFDPLECRDLAPRWLRPEPLALLQWLAFHVFAHRP